MGGNLAERGPLANTQKINLRNYGEYERGWLYLNPKISTENIPQNAKKTTTYRKPNEY